MQHAAEGKHGAHHSANLVRGAAASLSLTPARELRGASALPMASMVFC